jgi:hypothetical protein
MSLDGENSSGMCSATRWRVASLRSNVRRGNTASPWRRTTGTERLTVHTVDSVAYSARSRQGEFGVAQHLGDEPDPKRAYHIMLTGEGAELGLT